MRSAFERPTADGGPTTASYGDAVSWSPQKPRFHITYLILTWGVTALAVFFAAAVMPGVAVGPGGGLGCWPPIKLHAGTLEAPSRGMEA